MTARSSVGTRESTNTTAGTGLATLLNIDIPTFDGLAYSNTAVCVRYTLTWNISGLGTGYSVLYGLAQLASGVLSSVSQNSVASAGSSPPTIAVALSGTGVRYNVTPASGNSTDWFLVAEVFLYDPT